MRKGKLKTLRKYLFEIIVIFSGITLSFMFDEWRSARKSEEERRQLFESIKTQLSQAKSLLIKEDSILQTRVVVLEQMVNDEAIPDSLVIEFFNYAGTDFYVNLSGTLNTLRSLSEQGASTISQNALITKRISSVNSIAIDHARLTDDLHSAYKSDLTAFIVKYNISDDLFSYEYDDSVTYTGRYDALQKDPMFKSQLKIWYRKWDNLSFTHETLIRFLGEIENELDVLIRK
ncbi:MAG: hypothetical protein KF687_00105 [Cyclobacteriaceae bacterium]|nr:hypothetical protein [Cyclobacteriaceae bacterium]